MAVLQKNNVLQREDIWCVIPVFNNKNTVHQVAVECRKFLRNVLVVDDGSTDVDIPGLFSKSDIVVLRHVTNRGKGNAIRTALRYISERGGRFMITIDADGQHFPSDIEKFIPLIEEDEATIVIGSRNFNTPGVPKRSIFGRTFSNLWLRIETGVSIDDCQSGFRSYPVHYLAELSTSGMRYDFETEVLARAAWSGLKLRTVPVNTRYQESGLRVSSFRPFLDNLRISLMHARLVTRRLVPLPYRRLIPSSDPHFDMSILRHPVKLMKTLLHENTNPMGLAISAGVGIFLAVLPLLSVHTLVIIYVTTRLHLNKVMAVAIQNLCIMPFVPVACVELGHFMRYGKWLTDVSLHTVFGQLGERIYEWFLGSLILAPLMAVAVGVIVFFLARVVQKRQHVASTENPEKIIVKKRGNALGVWFFKIFLRFFGLKGAYWLLRIVCFYYLIFDRAAVLGAMAYIKRRFPDCGYMESLKHVYRLFISQGKQLIDRYALISKSVPFDISLRGYDKLVPLASVREKGLILLTTHVGNWQIAMTSIENLKKTVYMLMRPEDNPAIHNSLLISSEEGPIRVISPEQYLGGVPKIMEVLADGNIIAMMGDRGYKFNVVETDFLGSKAVFPCSAFAIAAATKCPVAILLSTKVAERKYSVDVAKIMNPSYVTGTDKRGQLKGWVQEYATLLESYLADYPYQCFLFHDIWKNIKTEA